MELPVRRVSYLLVTFICLLPLSAWMNAAQQQPARLLVTNKTGTTVELFAAVRDDWQSRGRISPGSSMPVYNVANGQRFRAVWGSRSKVVVINLTYSREYGGLQHLWELPGDDPNRE